MAEALLVEGSWSAEVELENPDGGAPHPKGWEEDDQRRAREDDLLNQAGVTDEVQGESQVTVVDTEQLAVSQVQVKNKLHFYPTKILTQSRSWSKQDLAQARS